MKPVKMITDPVAMELLGDDTRRRIIYLLRARELTISQIAEELRMTPQAIYHHIKKLLPVEMVEVTREERPRGESVEAGWRRFSRQTRTGKRRHNDIPDGQTIPGVAGAAERTEKAVEGATANTNQILETKDKLKIRSFSPAC